ncbi:MAG: prolipoprotein diacylglyceryl transferase [Rhodothermales bacterium]|nr:prolipoprotein diacylglyceryl transferase [Rhodothermales bacterium]
MYPRLSDILNDLFGVQSPLPIYSFGAMMAVAFLVAMWLTRTEMDRLYAAGRLGSVRLPVKDERKGRKVMKEMPPSALVGTFVMLAVVGGVLGAKLFHILENLDAFARDPLGMIFSVGGLTFFGGLICAAGAIAYYVRKKGLSVPLVADAVAPSLILGYGIGRIGCYLAGDGDWGVCSDLANKPGWIPNFLWSETFPRNLMGPGQTPLDVLAYENCPPGADGVFPTMLYEFAMCAVLFGILWALRKHPFKAGWLFSLYLVFTGLERFLIEQIRVNNEFEVFGLVVTQAEVLSVLIMLAGAVGLARTTKRRGATPTPPAQPVASAAA